MPVIRTAGKQIMSEYTRKELMTVSAARLVKDGDIVFCGTGISLLAAMAAKHISAPNSVIFFETGAIDSQLKELPLAVGDPRVMYRSAINSGLIDSFTTMQNPHTGHHVLGIMGAAQIDKYGNLNSTVIGEYSQPQVRFAGNGGASDVASLVGRTIIFMQHEKRKFVSKLDYLSSPGWLDGPGSREKNGLSPGGPIAVITNLGIMEFDNQSREMYLSGYYPGIEPHHILDQMEFEVEINNAREVPQPTERELHILRNICDPQRLILG